MRLHLPILKDYFSRLSLNTKLVALMLFLSTSLIATLIFLYYQTESSIYTEFEDQIAELSKGIQMGVEELTTSNLPEEKRLQNYLRKLQIKGVNEISIISNSDRILSSTEPRNVGKWITRAKKELIFKAELGEPVVGEESFYNVIVPVIANKKHYGYIHLKVNTEDFAARMKTKFIKRIAATSVIFGIGLILSIILAKRYTKPIEDAVHAARSVALGDLDQEIRTERKDEIGELARSFNYMVGKLKEERLLEERLRKAEHLAGIGQFSMSIAHEIRNPLNFISLSIDHMQTKCAPGDEEERKRFDSLIHNIKNEIQRVSMFAESFLGQSRPLELTLRRVDLGSLIGDVLEFAAAKALNSGILIEKEIAPLPSLSLDPGFVKTCLYNILINAFHAMPSGGTVSVRAGLKDGWVRVAVEDTGTGISAEHRARIFDPFFTTKEDGVGIGLALTKRIVEEHGGRIECASVEGRGSTVTIWLPLDKGREDGGHSRGR